MIPTETKLLPQEAIAFVDRLLAQHILLTKLCQIPAFIQLWRWARGPNTANAGSGNAGADLFSPG